MIEEEKVFQEEEIEKEDLPVKTNSFSDIVKKINEEEDVDKLKDLTKLFNLAMMKKEINRAERQSDILDYALEEVWSRIANGEMKDQDLAKYVQVLQDSINNTRKITSDDNLIPPIQINAKEININSDDSLTREERENVLDFIQKVLSQSQDKKDDIIDVESIKEGDSEKDDN